jgi:hypothetical protein
VNNSLYISSYHDCNSIVIAAILNKHRPVSEKYFWKQAGLRCINHDEFIEITPYYKDINDDLNRIGINFQEGKLILENALDFIIEQLSKKKNVGVRLNAFELPYSSSYQRGHNFHSIEIISYNPDQENFYVLDHFYRYEGSLSIEHFKKSIVATSETWRKYPEYFIYNIEGEDISSDEYDQLYLNKFLKENLEIMKKEQTIGSSKSTEGMGAVQTILNRVDESLADENEKALDYLYESIKNVANSRYHVSATLSNFHEITLSEHYLDAYQKWIIISNLILRSMIKKDYEKTRVRIRKSFDRLIGSETNIQNSIEEKIMVKD